MERPQKRSNPADSSYEAPAKRQATLNRAGSQALAHDSGDEDDEHEPQHQEEEDPDQEQSSYRADEDDGDDPQSTSEQQTPSRTAKRKAGRGAGSPGSLTSGGCRYDSSLGMLTKKFLSLINNAPDGILDLNKAAETLKVQKRRIYDITNVLEGVGLIEKKSKNNIRWKGASSGADKDAEPESARLKQDMAALLDQERSLDENIRIMTGAIQALSDNPLNRPRLYVTDDDVTGLPCFANDTIFAVKAPPGTTLEVPDPREAADPRDGQMRYRIVLRSTKGPIDVYLVQHTNNVGTTSQQGAAPSASAEPAGSTVGPGAPGSASAAAAAAAAAAGSGLGPAGSGAGAGAPAAAGPPTAIKQEPAARPMGQPGSPFPFALPSNTPLAGNGAASFFANAFASPGGPGAAEHLAGGHPGAAGGPGGPGLAAMGPGGEVDPAAWYNDDAPEPPLMAFYHLDNEEDNFFAGLG
ncbi:hypothetical protein HYH03_005326 [Edaphochlamys debaryana]|uniref:E2F/DP family winged-helix DNA-binding domain-containing protein n=1 Tax=Edaphochlamys debaryana TaxID=47281 RepID=A0A835Y5Q1_9CHLO|nr:hypothetical protein HYH03_005326 [Edaphochlamys debaryana]|eukprot:KAG2496501.1 hypothetical protein HYH03_005326 [Edaphochlamys debaryana]